MKLQKGYSVVELVLVVAVLGVVFALAVPNLIRANSSKKLVESGQEVVRLMHEARFRAIADNSSKKIIINTNDNTVRGSNGAVIKLPTGVRFNTLPGSIDPPAQIKDAVDKCGSLNTQKNNAKLAASFQDGVSTGVFQAEFDAKGIPKVEPGVVNWLYLVNGEGQQVAVIMTSAGACEVLQYNSKNKNWK